MFNFTKALKVLFADNEKVKNKKAKSKANPNSKSISTTWLTDNYDRISRTRNEYNAFFILNYINNSSKFSNKPLYVDPYYNQLVMECSEFARFDYLGQPVLVEISYGGIRVGAGEFHLSVYSDDDQFYLERDYESPPSTSTYISILSKSRRSKERSLMILDSIVSNTRSEFIKDGFYDGVDYIPRRPTLSGTALMPQTTKSNSTSVIAKTKSNEIVKRESNLPAKSDDLIVLPKTLNGDSFILGNLKNNDLCANKPIDVVCYKHDDGDCIELASFLYFGAMLIVKLEYRIKNAEPNIEFRMNVHIVNSNFDIFKIDKWEAQSCLRCKSILKSDFLFGAAAVSGNDVFRVLNSIIAEKKSGFVDSAFYEDGYSTTYFDRYDLLKYEIKK